MRREVWRENYQMPSEYSRNIVVEGYKDVNDEYGS